MNIDTTLNRDFVIVDLGSSSARQSTFLKKFSSQITYIEIDALSTSDIQNSDLYKNIKIKKGVHIERGMKQFIERNYMACSSFLEIKEGVDIMYGLEDAMKEKARIDIDCITLNDILAEHKLDHIDFLKVDLEGLDFDIIKNIENTLPDVNVIQAVIRFHPLFKGEKHFFEICQYLSDRGFEFINFSCLDEWKLNTSNQKNSRDGRMVWGDFVFFRKLDKSATGFTADLLKQILVSKSLQFNSYAEFLLESNRPFFDAELYQEVNKVIRTFGSLELFFNNLFGVFARSKLIYPIRKLLRYVYKRSRIHPTLKQTVP
ncbi:FkbM family methyltransferase [Taibaiella koreensis]|uniref:FkbM family methyltransferase n=1 Tax=Taibaiella koreensis TaxID=1268548 RepID=UPI000E59FB69|nr:FkbM family methyltransferase [Taibaiella koreensis]